MTDLSTRSAEEVLEDHLRCRQCGDAEGDLERNYSSDVVIMNLPRTLKVHHHLRALNEILQQHVPPNYDIVLKLVHAPYAFIEWRAREPGKSAEDGADSFVIKEGKIIFQKSIPA